MTGIGFYIERKRQPKLCDCLPTKRRLCVDAAACSTDRPEVRWAERNVDKEASRGFELRPLDSDSRMLTVTQRGKSKLVCPITIALSLDVSC